jgi:hypothetical protein
MRETKNMGGPAVASGHQLLELVMGERHDKGGRRELDLAKHEVNKRKE